MKRATVTVIGTSHMDFVAYVDEFPRPGETVIGSGFASTPGGKGANQAVAASRLGATCYLVSKVGRDLVGGILLENARRNGVRTEYIKEDPRSNSGVAIIYVSKRGENMIAVAPGVDHLISEEDVMDATPAISSSSVVMTQLEIPPKTAEFSIEFAKKMGKKTILNPAPAFELNESILRNVDFLTPNIVELATLTKMKIFDDKTALDAARKLLALGVGQVVITLGKRGALLVKESDHMLIPSYDVIPIDTVGAGDAFNGALAVAISIGCAVEDAVRFANLVAALKVTKKGAQEGLPTLEEVIEFGRSLGAEAVLKNFEGQGSSTPPSSSSE